MTKQPNRLEPCPMCGCEAYERCEESGGPYWIECDCGVRSAAFRWSDNGVTAWNTRAQPDRPADVVEQVADTPGAGMISEEDGLRELGLLYNYAEDDSRQFTRWQMLVAMTHGFGLATERAALSNPAASDRAEKMREALARTQWMLETIVRTNSTNFAEVHDRIIANRAALSEQSK